MRFGGTYHAPFGYIFDSSWHHKCQSPWGTQEYTAADVARGYRLTTRGLYPAWQEYVARLLEFRRTKA